MSVDEIRELIKLMSTNGWVEKMGGDERKVDDVGVDQTTMHDCTNLVNLYKIHCTYILHCIRCMKAYVNCSETVSAVTIHCMYIVQYEYYSKYMSPQIVTASIVSYECTL